MNEFGIDSLQLSNGQMITQAQIDAITFFIPQVGWLNGAYNAVGTSAFFSKTMTVYQYSGPSVKAMRNNNKYAGVFFFSHAWNAASAIYEANKTCDIVDTYELPPNFPIFLDWESTGVPGTGAWNALINAGITPTTALIQEVITAWKTRIEQRGYRAGFYTSGSLADTLVTNTWLQAQRANNLYYWEAVWAANPMHSCDIWQYNGDQMWMGVPVDYDKIQDDRIFNGGGSSNLPIWLKLKMARGSNNGKCTILL